jgi:hypothetical protein
LEHDFTDPDWNTRFLTVADRLSAGGGKSGELEIGIGADQFADRLGIGHAFFAEDLDALNRHRAHAPARRLLQGITKHRVIATFGPDGLAAVATAMRVRFPQKQLMIVANDPAPLQRSRLHAIEMAAAAAQLVGVEFRALVWGAPQH